MRTRSSLSPLPTARRLTSLAMLALGLMLVAAACGGASDSTTTETAEVATAVPVATEAVVEAAPVEETVAEPTPEPVQEEASEEPTDEPVEEVVPVADAYVPSAVDDPVAAEVGAFVFSSSCSGCHGEAGEGTNRGRKLVGVAMAQPDRLVHFNSVMNGTGRMPAFAENLSPEDIDAVVSYVRLTFVPDAIEADPVEAAAAAAVDPAVLAIGAEVFAASCASCHGDAGEGSSKGPSLAGVALSQPDAAVHVDIVINGKGRMPAFAENLTTEQIDAVVAYLRDTF